MNRRRHMPEALATHPNVTPLIDVVMCLIIFFMLVAKIGVSRGIDKDIDIPASILGQELQDPGNSLTLNVRPGPGETPMVTALVDNTSSQTQELRIVDPTTGKRPLLEVLKRLRDGDPKTHLPPNPEFKVIIRGDRDMGYRYLEPVLIACMEAKVKAVNFNTAKPGGS